MSTINEKKWALQWKLASDELEKERAAMLADLTISRAREISASLLGMATLEIFQSYSRSTSGLVEQQKYFRSWSK